MIPIRRLGGVLSFFCIFGQYRLVWFERLDRFRGSVSCFGVGSSWFLGMACHSGFVGKGRLAAFYKRDDRGMIHMTCDVRISEIY